MPDRFPSREAIYGALLDLLAEIGPPPTGDGTFLTLARRTRLPEDTPAQPALFIQESDEEYRRSTGVPATWKLMPKLILQARTDEEMTNGVPATYLNELVDKVERQLEYFDERGAGGRKTLGRLVTDCRIEGRLLIDEGLLDHQGLVIIPLTIVGEYSV